MQGGLQGKPAPQQQAAASAAALLLSNKGSQVQEGERLVHCNVGRGGKLRERKRRPSTGKCGFFVQES